MSENTATIKFSAAEGDKLHVRVNNSDRITLTDKGETNIVLKQGDVVIMQEEKAVKASPEMEAAHADADAAEKAKAEEGAEVGLMPVDQLTDDERDVLVKEGKLPNHEESTNKGTSKKK